MNVELKKGKSLEDSVRDQTTQSIEDGRKIEVVGENKLKEVFDKMMYVSELHPSLNMLSIFGNTVLTPDELNLLMAMVLPIAPGAEFYHANLSRAFNYLITNSFLAGNSLFEFDFKDDYTRVSLGALNGTSKNRQAYFRFNGDTYAAGGYSEHSIFNLRGNVNSFCGLSAENSNFNIYGGAEKKLGQNAKDSFFMIEGYAGYNCGCDSVNSTYVLLNSFGDLLGSGAKNCVFKTPNEDTLTQMLEVVGDISPDCTMVFVKSDGSDQYVWGNRANCPS
jgi:hypothetical protein